MLKDSIINDIYEKATKKKKTILFPDADDVRTIKAAQFLENNSIVTPILVGNTRRVEEILETENVSYNPTIYDPISSELTPELRKEFYQLRKSKGITEEQANQTINNPLYWAGMALRKNYADGCVAGSLSATGDVLRAAIQTVGTAQGISTVSSWFLMITDDRVMAYADCGVVPYPTPEQLSDIAFSTVTNFVKVTGIDPYIAFLSFSTKGSAQHPAIENVRNAFQIFSDKYPELKADGELQVDAALIPEIAIRKAPDSQVKGNANVLIFPNLDAGNIAYKLTERLAGAIAIGPLVQGLAKPYCDLSRGCSVSDIVTVAAITALMADSY